MQVCGGHLVIPAQAHRQPRQTTQLVNNHRSIALLGQSHRALKPRLVVANPPLAYGHTTRIDRHAIVRALADINAQEHRHCWCDPDSHL
jgi:hypothetical protein